MILLIDNYDSFTYNLVQIMENMGLEVTVCRNNRIDLQGIADLAPSALMISPGPGSPSQAGISIDAIKSMSDKIPVLGVCLGHQSIARAFGGKIIRADRIMHGKTSKIFHDNKGVFKSLANPFEAVRYHSLIVEKVSLPDCLEISAWTDQDEIMGIRHLRYPVEGVQFHPESIISEEGDKLLKNFQQMEDKHD